MKRELKFYLITDSHFFKNSLGAYGEGYDSFMEFEQKCFAETEAINHAVIEYLKSSDEADIVLIAGDLTFNGERESHMEYRRLLKELTDSGKMVYVVTAGHDVNPKPWSYPGTAERVPVEGVSFDELYDIYKDFGYGSAIALNREHMSYVAQLDDGVRLLVICNDTAQGRGLAYSDEFLGWIKEQLDCARADGQMIFAMEHYPVLPGQPILSLIGDATQKESQKLINLLADNGCHLIFTGHMHNQSINTVTTNNGNRFFDVCTGSIIGCPAYMRLCTIKDESTAEITSIPVPHFEWNTEGMSCEEYLQRQFDKMIINLLSGMRDNPIKTMKKIGLKRTKISVALVRKLGKALCNKTVGQLLKLLAVKAEPEVKDIPLIDILTAIVRNVFCGNQPFTEETPEGKTMLRLFGRMKPLFFILNKKLKDSQGNPVDLFEILKHSAGNYGIDDYNAVLKLK